MGNDVLIPVYAVWAEGSLRGAHFPARVSSRVCVVPVASCRLGVSVVTLERVRGLAALSRHTNRNGGGRHPTRGSALRR